MNLEKILRTFVAGASLCVAIAGCEKPIGMQTPNTMYVDQLGEATLNLNNLVTNAKNKKVNFTLGSEPQSFDVHISEEGILTAKPKYGKLELECVKVCASSSLKNKVCKGACFWSVPCKSPDGKIMKRGELNVTLDTNKEAELNLSDLLCSPNGEMNFLITKNDPNLISEIDNNSYPRIMKIKPKKNFEEGNLEISIVGYDDSRYKNDIVKVRAFRKYNAEISDFPMEFWVSQQGSTIINLNKYIHGIKPDKTYWTAAEYDRERLNIKIKNGRAIISHKNYDFKETEVEFRAFLKHAGMDGRTLLFYQPVIIKPSYGCLAKDNFFKQTSENLWEGACLRRCPETGEIPVNKGDVIEISLRGNVCQEKTIQNQRHKGCVCTEEGMYVMVYCEEPVEEIVSTDGIGTSYVNSLINNIHVGPGGKTHTFYYLPENRKCKLRMVRPVEGSESCPNNVLNVGVKFLNK